MPFITTIEPLVILRTPSLIDTTRPKVFKAPTEIRFFLSWGIYLTSFNSYTIPSNILIQTVPIPSTLHRWLSSMTTKYPSSFLKLENQSLFGHTWLVAPVSNTHSESPEQPIVGVVTEKENIDESESDPSTCEVLAWVLITCARFASVFDSFFLSLAFR